MPQPRLIRIYKDYNTTTKKNLYWLAWLKGPLERPLFKWAFPLTLSHQVIREIEPNHHKIRIKRDEETVLLLYRTIGVKSTEDWKETYNEALLLSICLRRFRTPVVFHDVPKALETNIDVAVDPEPPKALKIAIAELWSVWKPSQCYGFHITEYIYP